MKDRIKKKVRKMLFERKRQLDQFRTEIRVVTNFEMTDHAREQQTRFDLEGPGFVTDSDLKLLVESMLPRVIKAILQGDIQLYDEFAMTNTTDGTTLVATIEPLGGSILELRGITTHRKKNFRTSDLHFKMAL